jgi:hypothetical protein
MPTTEQKTDLLFKKYLGKGSSAAGYYFNEQVNARVAVYPTQIWTDYASIPNTATIIPGVVSQVVDLVLNQVPGASNINAYYHANLKDAIPFNFDPLGSYAPVLKKSDGSVIATTDNSDWLVDTEAGMVTFYGGRPSGVSESLLPKITFWRYVGSKGAGGGGGGTLKDFMSGQIESPTVDNVYYLVANNPSYMTVTSMSISLYSGTGTASLKVDNIPIGGISSIPLQTTETTYESSLISGQPVPTGSRLTLELNDMSVGAGRIYFTIALTRMLTA